VVDFDLVSDRIRTGTAPAAGAILGYRRRDWVLLGIVFPSWPHGWMRSGSTAWIGGAARNGLTEGKPPFHDPSVAADASASVLAARPAPGWAPEQVDRPVVRRSSIGSSDRVPSRADA
jgi:hypothetical protein